MNGPTAVGSKKQARWLEVQPEFVATQDPDAVEAKAIHWAKAGDRDAFSFLFGRYEERLYSYLLRWFRDESSAEDVLQETALKAFGSLHRFRDGASFRPWIFKLATNEAKMYVRSRSRRDRRHEAFGQVVTREPVRRSISMEYHMSVAVEDALSQMTPSDRRLLLLRFHEGLSLSEVSSVVGAPTPIVKVRVHRARARFRKAIEAIESKRGALESTAED